MKLSARIGVFLLVGLYAVVSFMAGFAYGPLAALAVIVVMIGPLGIGILFCLPDEAETVGDARVNPIHTGSVTLAH